MRDVERASWTRHDVERQLVAAFAARPSLSVYASEMRLQANGTDGAEMPATLRWAAILADDADARKYLWAWARCRATRTSYAELCRTMGWPRATAEKGRRRAAAAIAVWLSREARLDR